MFFRGWTRRLIHVSWLIAGSCLGLLIGVASAFMLNIVAHVSWLLLALALFGVVLLKRTITMIVLAIIAGWFLGVFIGSEAFLELRQYEEFYGKEVEVHGKVDQDPATKPNGDIQFRLSQVNIQDRDFPGTVWLNTKSYTNVKRGDFVSVKGNLKEGFGTIQASISGAELVDVNRPLPGDIARQLRDNFNEGVYAVMPESKAHLGISFLTGQRNLLSEDQSERLRMLGLVHIVVASGFHLTIVIKIARRISLPVSRYFALFISSSIIINFLLLTGFSTSMTRASLVSGISLAAWYYGRVVHPVVLLLLVAAITVMINPIVMTGDLGWFLSFAAFGGVIILAPLIEHYFWGKTNQKKPIRQIIVATTAAQITTFPIIALTMGQYSPLALLSNLLILPVVPFAMLGTFIAGIGGLFFGSSVAFLAWPTQILLEYILYVTAQIAELPWAYAEIEFSSQNLIFSYVIIGFVTLFLKLSTKHRFKEDDFL